MLGVRHVGITAAAGGLQRSGLIECTRPELTVFGRKGLEAIARGGRATDRHTCAESL